MQKKYFCGMVMLSEKDNISEFNQYMNLDKVPNIYANSELLIKIRPMCK